MNPFLFLIRLPFFLVALPIAVFCALTLGILFGSVYLTRQLLLPVYWLVVAVPFQLVVSAFENDTSIIAGYWESSLKSWKDRWPETFTEFWIYFSLVPFLWKWLQFGDKADQMSRFDPPPHDLAGRPGGFGETRITRIGA